MFFDIQYINPTFVVSTASDFDKWSNNTSGYDYTSVLIKNNITVTSTKSQVVNVTTTGTKLVNGYGNSSITVSGNYGCVFAANDGWECQFKNVHVKGGYGFRNCSQLIKCSSIASPSGGFYNCKDLLNCTVTFPDGFTGGSLEGFYICTHLVNCEITGHTSTSGTTYGFDSCSDLINCNCYLAINNPNSSSGASYLFFYCNDLVNCFARFNYFSSGSGMQACFYKCDKLVNCDLQVLPPSGSSPNSGWNNYTYDHCTDMLNCTSLFWDSMPAYARSCERGLNNNVGYRRSSDSVSMNGSDTWADTANGGWNVITVV